MVDEETEYLNYTATRLQSVARKYVVRRRVLKQVFDRYEKILDPKRRRHYYYDKKLDKSSWKKPPLLFNNDLPDVAPTYTKKEAVEKIQLMVRRYLALLKVRLLYQVTIVAELDPSSGYTFYFNPRTNQTMWSLPNFMGGRMNHARKVPTARVKKVGGRRKKVSDLDEEDNANMTIEEVIQKRRLKRIFPR